MSGGAFVVFLALGGAALSLWIDVRFPKLGPRELRPVLIHLVASFIAVQLAMFLFKLAAEGSQIATLAGVFAIALPALVYCFLVSIWMIRTAQGALRHR